MAEPLRKEDRERNQYYEPANDSGSNVRNIKNVKVEKKKLTSQQANRLSAPQIAEYTQSSKAGNSNTSYYNDAYPDSSEVFKKQTDDRSTAAMLRDQDGADKKKEGEKQEQARQAFYVEQQEQENAQQAEQQQMAQRARKATKKARRKLKKKKKATGTKVIKVFENKAKIGAVNTLHTAFYAPTYKLALIPFGIFYTIFFAMSFLVGEALSIGDDERLLGHALAGISNLINWGADFLAGYSIEDVTYGLTLLSLMIIFTINIIFIFSLMICYMTAGVNPLGGKMAWVKWVLFILMFISSVIPVLCLAPVVGIWMWINFVIPK